LAAKA